MTRRLAIVNLSNWPNEDFWVEADGNKRQLAPGEFVELSDWGQGRAAAILAIAEDNPDAKLGYHPWEMNVYQPEAN